MGQGRRAHISLLKRTRFIAPRIALCIFHSCHRGKEKTRALWARGLCESSVYLFQIHANSGFDLNHNTRSDIDFFFWVFTLFTILLFWLSTNQMFVCLYFLNGTGHSRSKALFTSGFDFWMFESRVIVVPMYLRARGCKSTSQSVRNRHVYVCCSISFHLRPRCALFWYASTCVTFIRNRCRRGISINSKSTDGAFERFA